MGQFALTNLRRHRLANRLYVLVTAAMIAVLYAVAALRTDRPLLHQVSRVLEDTTIIPTALTIALAIMGSFTVTFLVYMNNLLRTRRQRELGLYRLLGMPAGRLAGSLLLEALVDGVAAAGLGIAVGVLLSKFFALALARLMNLAVAAHVLWSPQAVVELFGATMLVSVILGVINGLAMRGGTLRRLISAPAAAGVLTPLTGWRRVMALVGLALWVAVQVGAFNVVPLLRWSRAISGRFAGAVLLMAGLVAGLLGVYWLYRYGLPWLLQILARRPHWHDRAVSLLTLTNLFQRLQRNSHSLWLTTVLATLTMVVLGSGAVLYQFSQTTVHQDAPVDVTTAGTPSPAVQQALRAAPQAIAARVVMPSKLVVGKGRLKTRLAGTSTETTLYNVISLTTYRRLRGLQPELPALTLVGNQTQMSLLGQGDYRRQWLRHWTNDGRTLTLLHDGTRLRLHHLLAVFPLGLAATFDRLLVVTDSQYARLQGTPDVAVGYRLRANAAGRRLERRLFALSERPNATEYATANRAVMQGKKLARIRTHSGHDSAYTRATVTVRRPILTATDTLFGFGLFLAVLMGAVFLIATASILSLKQLAASSRDRADMQTVLKLGMPRANVRAVLYHQTLWLFGLPLVVGILNALSVTRAFSLFLDNPSAKLMVLVIALYAAVFMGFGWATARLLDAQAPPE